MVRCRSAATSRSRAARVAAWRAYSRRVSAGAEAATRSHSATTVTSASASSRTDVAGLSPTERLLRELASQVLGIVVRRYGDFSAAEDAVQEALAAAALQWPNDGIPDNPRAWLIHVAARR